MNHGKKNNKNLMEKMRQIIWEIDELKPEPEICNVSCPPFGCPLGPCLGMCCSNDFCDLFCISKIPKNASSSTCSVRSYPLQSSPPSFKMTSYPSSKSQHIHSQQYLTPSIGPSTSNRTQRIIFPQQNSSQVNQHDNNQRCEISICQVPSINHHKSYSHPLFKSPNINSNSNFDSTRESCSPSPIEICYPSICSSSCSTPMSYVAQHNKEISQQTLLPYYNTYNYSQLHLPHHTQNDQQFSSQLCDSSFQQICPPNSSYLVTIPYR